MQSLEQHGVDLGLAVSAVRLLPGRAKIIVRSVRRFCCRPCGGAEVTAGGRNELQWIVLLVDCLPCLLLTASRWQCVGAPVVHCWCASWEAAVVL